jgi:hypothetical protein
VVDRLERKSGDETSGLRIIPGANGVTVALTW